jgi:cation:H+ antiporter
MTPERPAHPARQQAWIVGALAVAVPGVALRFAGEPRPWLAAIVFGIAIVGAAFMLAWAAEVAQLDISQALALAVLAFIAVLPEYAVTFVFAAKAGRHHGDAPLVLANMTGANRLLIGIGWSMVVLLAAYRRRAAGRAAGAEAVAGATREGVSLERSHSIEIGFLLLATTYSLLLPLRSHLALIDAAVLLAIFVGYILRVSRAPAEEPHLVGPAQYLGSLPVTTRRIAISLLFLLSAGVILACAEPFADALVHTGAEFGIDRFLLVQWLAPLASEAPELLVAGLFAWRLRANTGLGALVSSKVNQWTLLVGTVPIVFALTSHGTLGLPMNTLVREELFLTAAQSAFAVAVLANRELSIRESVALLALFLGQFVLGGVLPEGARPVNRVGFGTLYFVAAAGVAVNNRRAIGPLLRDAFRTPMTDLGDG